MVAYPVRPDLRAHLVLFSIIAVGHGVDYPWYGSSLHSGVTFSLNKTTLLRVTFSLNIDRANQSHIMYLLLITLKQSSIT
jgi:hypothetical protein